MSDDSVPGEKKASRSVQEHIEELLKTVIIGLTKQPEPEKAGRPRSLRLEVPTGDLAASGNGRLVGPALL